MDQGERSATPTGWSSQARVDVPQLTEDKINDKPLAGS